MCIQKYYMYMFSKYVRILNIYIYIHHIHILCILCITYILNVYAHIHYIQCSDTYHIHIYIYNVYTNTACI